MQNTKTFLAPLKTVCTTGSSRKLALRPTHTVKLKLELKLVLEISLDAHLGTARTIYIYIYIFVLINQISAGYWRNNIVKANLQTF